MHTNYKILSRSCRSNLDSGNARISLTDNYLSNASKKSDPFSLYFGFTSEIIFFS